MQFVSFLGIWYFGSNRCDGREQLHLRLFCRLDGEHGKVPETLSQIRGRFQPHSRRLEARSHWPEHHESVSCLWGKAIRISWYGIFYGYLFNTLVLKEYFHSNKLEKESNNNSFLCHSSNYWLRFFAQTSILYYFVIVFVRDLTKSAARLRRRWRRRTRSGSWTSSGRWLASTFTRTPTSESICRRSLGPSRRSRARRRMISR